MPDSQIVIIQANADALSTVQTGRADAYAATELTVRQLVKVQRRRCRAGRSPSAIR